MYCTFMYVCVYSWIAHATDFRCPALKFEPSTPWLIQDQFWYPWNICSSMVWSEIKKYFFKKFLMPSKSWPCSLHHVCRFCYLIWSKTSSSPYVLLVKCLFKELRLRLRFLLLAPYWNWKWFPSATEMTWHSPRPVLSFSSQGESWCEAYKRSSHNFMEN